MSEVNISLVSGSAPPITINGCANITGSKLHVRFVSGSEKVFRIINASCVNGEFAEVFLPDIKCTSFNVMYNKFSVELVFIPASEFQCQSSFTGGLVGIVIAALAVVIFGIIGVYFYSKKQHANTSVAKPSADKKIF
jgi:hypothetical protein